MSIHCDGDLLVKKKGAAFGKALPLAAVSLMALAWVSPARAQDVGTQDADQAQSAADAGDAGRIEDIVVTANRRDETIQKSSLAVVAFSEGELRNAGISQPGDLTKLTPGLQVSAVGPSSAIYVRGIGATSANPLSNPGVIFNMDGVYVGRPEAVNSNFFDVARMEVVKGPQGTLYGRNASGGAINLITNAPRLDELSGALNMELGNYDLFHVDGAINVPLGEKVAVRAAFNRIKRDGFLTDGTNDDNQTAGRLKLLYQPTEDVSLTVTGDFADLRGKGGGYVLRPARADNPWEGLGTDESNAYVATLPGSSRVSPQGKDAFLHNNYRSISAQLDWDLGFGTLTIIPAYRHAEIDGQFYALRKTRNTTTADQETLEMRLGGSTADLKWVAGLYYFHEKDPGTVRLLISPTVSKSQIDYDPEGTSYAAFGEAQLTVADGFRLTGGLRYTIEHRLLSGDIFSFPGGGDTPSLVEEFDGDKTFRALTWKAGAEYDVGPQSMLFLTATKGFKSGGINQTVAPDNIFQPEEVVAFEAGSRNRFFDDRLQVNLEAFYWSYKNQQTTTATTDHVGFLNFLTRNAGNAHIYGANLDIVAKLSSRDTLRVAGEYNRSKYTEYTFSIPSFVYNPAATACTKTGTIPGAPPQTQLDCSGFELAHAPRWSGAVDYTHEFDLGPGTLSFNANARFSSSYFLTVDFTDIERAPSFAILNASLSYKLPDAGWSITGYVRNITNEVEYTGAQQSTQILDVLPSTIGAPRTYGVQLRYEW